MPRTVATPLSQKTIDSTSPPASGRTVLRDHDAKGLSLRITPSGAKSWSYEFKSPLTGKNGRVTLPNMSLAEARARAREMRVAVANGRDPGVENKHNAIARQAAHSSVLTVAGALDLYETAVVKTAARTVSRRARMSSLRKTLEPFNSAAAAQLKRGPIMLRLDDVQATRGPIARNRAQSEIRHWLGWLHDRGLVETIALDRVKKAVKEQARERVLVDRELTAIMIATIDRSPFSDIVRVLMHTGMRRGEAANLQPRDLDFGAATIRVRNEVSKTRQSRLIPMDEAIAPMLEERAGRVGQEKYIFGDGSDYRKPFSGWGKRFAALAKAVGSGERWTLHDIRRTVATRLQAWTDPLMIEDLLGHTTGMRGGMAGVYNRAETLARQRPALREWSVLLANLENSQKLLASAH